MTLQAQIERDRLDALAKAHAEADRKREIEKEEKELKFHELVDLMPEERPVFERLSPIEKIDFARRVDGAKRRGEEPPELIRGSRGREIDRRVAEARLQAETKARLAEEEKKESEEA